MRYPSILIGLCAAGLFGFTACDKKEGAAAAPTSGPVADTDGVLIMRLTGDDLLKFSAKEFTVKAGSKLRVEMTNVGKMPRETMAHNWMLVKPIPEAELNALAMSASSRPPEHLPENQSAILFHTKVLGPGEKDVIEITVPAEAGTYPYICTFPGHFPIMRGKMIVTP
jgi:azurin